MITKDSIETAYCFFHQKRRIYEHSTLAWQKDDIESAVGEYAGGMSAELYAEIAGGNGDFLKSHATFPADIALAEEKLEQMMGM